jgi:pyrimidine operon attenuation protein/uracil phosphoribosyltransferase
VSASKILLDSYQLHITMSRLSQQLLENGHDLRDTCFIGIQPRGVFFARRIMDYLARLVEDTQINYGQLDITFYRDDVHQGYGMHVPSETNIPFEVEGKHVMLIDDVLHTGRTIRAAMDALLAFGRPKSISLMVLIDRRYSRELPIQPDYTGRSIDTIMTQKVKVNWEEDSSKDEVVLID